MDIVADELSPSEYKPEEDPRAYVSSRSGRGPLKPSWRADHQRAIELLRSGAARCPAQPPISRSTHAHTHTHTHTHTHS